MKTEVPWIQRRIRGVTAILTRCGSAARKVAWAAGTVAVFIVYPLAMSIVEDRVVKRQ